MSDTLDLDTILAFAIQLALDVSAPRMVDLWTGTLTLDGQAGKLIREGQERRFTSEASEDTKLNSVDVSGPTLAGTLLPASLTVQLVTEVDKAVEAFITKKIKEQYPEHQLCVDHFITARCEAARGGAYQAVSAKKHIPASRSRMSQHGSVCALSRRDTSILTFAVE